MKAKDQHDKIYPKQGNMRKIPLNYFLWSSTARDRTYT